MPTKKDKTPKPKPVPEVQSEKKRFKLSSSEVIGLLSVLAIIVAGFLTSPLIVEWIGNSATLTETATDIATTQVADTQTAVVQGFTPIVSPGDVVDAKGIVMVMVPAGKFTMGSDIGDDDEKPPHDVYLDAYYIDKYEVTNALYKTCVDTGICQLPSDVRHYDDPKYANHPVVYVDWNMAQTYCEWRGTRLPTESEWEKAARGTDNRIYPWGDTASCEYANYSNCVGDSTEIGKYKSGASPYGIYDIGGNVWEWVGDWYLSDYYQILGSDALNPQGPTSGENRGARGGGFGYDSFYMRVANRSWGNTFYNDTGFRCARPESTSATATAVVTLTASAAELNLPPGIVDSKGAEMVLVSAGEFTMGTDNDDAESNEKPAHQVFVSAFYLDKYEVTNALYKACVDAQACAPLKYISSSTRDNYFGNPEFDNYPVITVDWDMANTFCAWRDARLPTEAEWEKAARGTDGRTYPWGEDADNSFANYNLKIGDTTPVGSYESDKSIYGVYDMAGNVYEWIADWYSSGYYKTSPYENPLGPNLGKYRAVRGSSWYSVSEEAMTYHRGWLDPSGMYSTYGFRCAKDANP